MTSAETQWLYQLSYLIFILTACTILLFFTKRAYIIWDRSKFVLFLCLSFIIPAFVLGITSAALGMVAPWGLQPLSNDEFLEWSPFFGALIHKSHNVIAATVVSQLLAAIVVCFAICYGIFRHRNGFTQMDTASESCLTMRG
jgi:hypothetical protein